MHPKRWAAPPSLPFPTHEKPGLNPTYAVGIDQTTPPWHWDEGLTESDTLTVRFEMSGRAGALGEGHMGLTGLGSSPCATDRLVTCQSFHLSDLTSQLQNEKFEMNTQKFSRGLKRGFETLALLMIPWLDNRLLQA